jgi:CBS-domain-containing membrane protein
VVIAYEMFARFKDCPWAQRPLLVPVTCGLSATATLLIMGWLGNGAMAAALSALCGTIVLRIFRLHFPPAVAVALLPYVMKQPDFRYPVAIMMGTAILCVAFLLWRSLRDRTA